MATYAIGDVQGCFDALNKLLDKIKFDPCADTLWFTGDLVNRGRHSLAVLRFIKSLNGAITVLGNHDLHLLAVAHGVTALRPTDTFEDILKADDREELIAWLRHQPLLHEDEAAQYVMTHAGIAPLWDLILAKQLAAEVESVLRGKNPEAFLQQMYGNEPSLWQADLTGMPRLRCITNYFTRMRFCTAEGRLNLTAKGTLDDQASDHIPWFKVPHRIPLKQTILFGHWAALGGKTQLPHIQALDTGCVWGNGLTALRLYEEERFMVMCNDRA